LRQRSNRSSARSSRSIAPGSPSSMPADFPPGCADGGGGRCGVGHGGAPAWGTNGGSIADRSEYRNNILIILFYRRILCVDGAPGRLGARRQRGLSRRRRARRAERQLSTVGTPRRPGQLRRQAHVRCVGAAANPCFRRGRARRVMAPGGVRRPCAPRSWPCRAQGAA
jgi:hypothetical protein